MRYAFNSFTLDPNQPVSIRGSNSLYTFQNTSDSSVLVQGSNDAVAWFNLVTVSSNSTETIQSAYKFLQCSGGSISVNRAAVNNPSNGSGLTTEEVQDLIDTSLSQIPSGGGFSYGGNWDAAPAHNYQDITTLTEGNSYTYESNVMTNTATNANAIVYNISKEDAGTDRNFRFTWPDTTTSAFAICFFQSSLTDFMSITSDAESALVGIGAEAGTPLSLSKNTLNPISALPLSNINIGDTMRVGYRAATNTLYVYNETQGNSLVLTISLDLVINLSESFNLLIGLVGLNSLNLDFTDSFGYPLQADELSFVYPTDTSKTYLAINASSSSVINNKKITNGCFVNFITVGNEVVDVQVTRLVTDIQIKQLVLSELQNSSSDIYTAVSSIATVGVIHTVNSELQNDASDTYLYVSNAASNSFAIEMANNMSTTYSSVYGTATQAIVYETQPSGIIDTAIQTAITP